MTPQPAAPPPAGPPLDRRVVLQAGFGRGHTFLQTWQAWRDDPHRPARLDFIAIEGSPPGAQVLRDVHRDSTVQPLADELAACWPPRTRNLHRLAFEGGRVHLLLAFGNALKWLPELQAQVNAFLIDAVDVSADAQGGTQRLCKALARLAAPQASLVTTVALHRLQRSLVSAGFQLEACPTALATAAATPVTRAVYHPGFVPRHRVRPASAAGERHALIVGAGLAGCATACALAEQGWRSTLIDHRDGPAQEGSGNPAGLFHGIVNAQDGAHARFNRAAALQASRAVQLAIDRHGAKGGLHGLLRLHTAGQTASDMRALLASLKLPPDFVQALDAA
ncbi:MAG: FAD-dependent oxidoreductase, partial [Rubrivivax sp.]